MHKPWALVAFSLDLWGNEAAPNDGFDGSSTSTRASRRGLYTL
jgi:hypothetical protein